MSRDPAETPESKVAQALWGVWPWFAHCLMGKTVLSDVRIEGFSVRFDVGIVHVVVKALHLERVAYVVAFGSGETMWVAMRNATHAIRKGEWKPDRFRSMH